MMLLGAVVRRSGLRECSGLRAKQQAFGTWDCELICIQLFVRIYNACSGNYWAWFLRGRALNGELSSIPKLFYSIPNLCGVEAVA